MVLVQPGLETGATLVRQYVSESSRDRDAAVLVDKRHNELGRGLQRDSVPDRDEDRLHVRTATYCSAEHHAVVYDVREVAAGVARFGIRRVVGDSVERLRDADGRHVQTERRVCGDAHLARMEHAVSVKNEQIWLFRKLFDGFLEEREFAEGEEPRHIRDFDTVEGRLELDHLVRVEVDDRNYADSVLAVLAVPVGQVHSGDQTDRVSLELVGLDDLATESVLNFQKFLFHTSQCRKFRSQPTGEPNICFMF